MGLWVSNYQQGQGRLNSNCVNKNPRLILRTQETWNSGVFCRPCRKQQSRNLFSSSFVPFSPLFFSFFLFLPLFLHLFLFIIVVLLLFLFSWSHGLTFSLILAWKSLCRPHRPWTHSTLSGQSSSHTEIKDIHSDWEWNVLLFNVRERVLDLIFCESVNTFKNNIF